MHITQAKQLVLYSTPIYSYPDCILNHLLIILARFQHDMLTLFFWKMVIYINMYIQNKNILLFQCTLKFVKWIYVYSLELETFQYIRAPVPIFMLKLELFKFLNSHFSSCFLPGASHAMRQQVLIDNFDTREEFVRSQGIAFASIAILGLMVTPLAGYKSYLLLNPL